MNLNNISLVFLFLYLKVKKNNFYKLFKKVYFSN